MKDERKVDNTLFTTTLGSVALMIIAVVGTILSVHHAAGIELSLFLLSVPGTSSAVLLYKAIKKEKHYKRNMDMA